MEIDLNADLGEGAGSDADLMPLITSANVCCGLHAGGPGEMAAAFTLAARHRVVAGAHPGYADREHFGRVPVALDGGSLFALCIYQIGAAAALGKASGAPVRFVKPHGALYHRACAEPDAALRVAEACLEFGLPVVGLPGSALQAATSRVGLPFVPEGYADRRYRADGSLVSRSEAGAFVHDPAEAVEQVDWLTREKGVRTVCVHGDNPQAVAFARAVRAALVARGFTLRPFA